MYKQAFWQAFLRNQCLVFLIEYPASLNKSLFCCVSGSQQGLLAQIILSVCARFWTTLENGTACILRTTILMQYHQKALTRQDIAKPWCCRLQQTRFGRRFTALVRVKLRLTESSIQTGCVSKTIAYWNFCFSQHFQHNWFTYESI